MGTAKGKVMSDLFRAEALRHRAEAASPSGVPPTAPAWLGRLYWVLIVGVAAGVAAAWWVRLDGDRLLTILVGHG